MNQEKSMANALFDDGNRLVIRGPDGVGLTFYCYTNRTMWLKVRRLQVSHNQCPVCGDACLVEFGGGTLDSPSLASLSVGGRATLENGSVSVIGAPGTTAHTLDIEFVALDDDAYKRHQQEELRRGAAEPYPHATLGFVHQQQSAAPSDDWFVVCELAPDTLHAICNALSSGALQAMTIGLAFPEIYSDKWTHPPGQTSWFLGLNHHGSKTDQPQKAHGHVTHLSFEAATSKERDELKEFEVAEAGPSRGLDLRSPIGAF